MLRTLAVVAFLASIPAAALADDVIRFDLGAADDASGDEWNDITVPTQTGVILNGAVTTSGRQTGVTYGHVRAFAGIDSTGHTGYAPYPSRATRDGFTLGTPGTRDAVIEIGGLSPAKSYDSRFYGSTRETSARKRPGSPARSRRPRSRRMRSSPGHGPHADPASNAGGARSTRRPRHSSCRARIPTRAGCGSPPYSPSCPSHEEIRQRPEPACSTVTSISCAPYSRSLPS
jgi:hypothetical protein